MSVPAYPSYRDSGIAWLSDVPSHWNTVRLRRLVEIRKRIAGEEGPEVLSITQKGIKVRDTASNDGQLASSYAHYQLVLPGDFAMNHMDLLTGWVDISSLHGVTSPDYRVFTLLPGRAVDPRFLLAVLQLGYIGRTFYALGQGSSHLGRWRLPANAFNEFEIALPPLAEQAAIATFLDRETAKIDALVEEQRRLVELLKEKRQAVISHAVTKGLDPTVPMMDSGVEWLGEVPANWGMSRVKYAATHVVDCLHTTPTYDGELAFPAVRTADVERGRLLLDQARLVSREVYEERVQRLVPLANDILYTREGERFGLAALVPPGVELCLGQRMMMLRVNDVVDPAYVMWVLNSDAVYQQVVAGIAGATAPHVNISEVINFHLPVPPMGEQRLIADHIERVTGLLDNLSAEAEAAITLLQERRAALISAAVTGKIDVRGWSETEVRKAVCAEIVHFNARSRTFGRVKNQKLIYLAEAHAGVHEIGGHYTRHAAGPYDGDLIALVERQLETDGVMSVSQPDGAGAAVNYSVTRGWKPDRERLKAMLGDRLGKLDHINTKLADLDTRSTEAIATLYAVWNDALLDGGPVDDASLVHGFLQEWHPEKRQKFREADLHNWLGWMRRNGLVPEGQGPKTTTGRLFT